MASLKLSDKQCHKFSDLVEIYVINLCHLINRNPRVHSKIYVAIFGNIIYF